MSNIATALLALGASAGLSVAPLLADTTGFSLGDPPHAPTAAELLQLKRGGPRQMSRTGPFVVDTASREQVRLFHQTVYSSSEGIEPGWTGDPEACQPGTISPEFQDAVARRINYFRALAGIPAGVTLDSELSAKDQEAALMMSVNNTLSHYPPMTWSCYTADGAEAARNSNLAIGRIGPHAVDGYMEDFGSGNAAVGHRRWLLYPQTQMMGTGDVPGAGTVRGANALWVLDENHGGPRPETRGEAVTWPPAGYVPFQVVYPRWSFSYPGANFTSASVSFTGNGTALPVVIEPLSGNIGENTLVWYPGDLDPGNPYPWPRPTSDTVYEVAVHNVVIGGTSREFTYSVIVFDPASPGPDAALPEITGPAEPAVGHPNSYLVSNVPHATAYQYRASRRTAFNDVDGAENGAGNFRVSVSPGYDVVVTAPRSSGFQAFHLAHPTLTPQSITYLPVLVPSQNAHLEFQSRLGWATVNQVARAQVLVGGSGTWQDVYSQPGSDGPGESSFNLKSISLAPFAGRSIEIRFVYDGSNGTYFAGADAEVGWYLDEIAVHQSEVLEVGLPPAPFQGESFTWNPAAEGDFALEARAQVFGDFYAEWGPVHSVTAALSTMPTVLRFVGPPILADGQLEFTISIENYQPDLDLVLLRTDDIAEQWTVDREATFETITPDSQFRVRTPVQGTALNGYFRLRSN